MTFSGIKELDVDVNYLKVWIRESEESEVRTELSNIPGDMTDNLLLYQEDAELNVEIRGQNEWTKRMKNFEEDATLTIWIPKDTKLYSASIACGAGELLVDNIQAKELELEIGAGFAEVANFTVDQLDVSCEVGEVSLFGTAMQESQIECGIGAVGYQAVGSKGD